MLNIKVLNIQTMPSTIPIQFVEFKKDTLKFFENLVLEPKYIRGLALIANSSFKLMPSGITLDTELKFLSYLNVLQELADESSSRQTAVKNNITCNKSQLPIKSRVTMTAIWLPLLKLTTDLSCNNFLEL